jgi:transcriptional regulator with XRE-family HTH domain
MSSDAVRAFGQEVRRRRIALAMNLKMLGVRAEITPSFLSMVEMGRRRRGPSLRVALRIAKGLGTDLPDLLGGFHGLTPEGIQIARVVQILSPGTRAALLEFMRALAADKKRA